MTAVGAAGVLSSLYGGAPMSLFAFGLLAVLAGVLISLPLAVGPLASLIGVPLRLRGLPGSSPSRTPSATLVGRPPPRRR